MILSKITYSREVFGVVLISKKYITIFSETQKERKCDIFDFNEKLINHTNVQLVIIIPTNEYIMTRSQKVLF